MNEELLPRAIDALIVATLFGAKIVLAIGLLHPALV